MKKLIFVYNADSGWVNALKDWAHKIVSPETYACSLCALTYNNLGMHRPWREFIRDLGYEVEFLHRDELEDQHGIRDIKLPAAFILENGKLRLLLESGSLDDCQSLGDLQTLVTRALSLEAG